VVVVAKRVALEGPVHSMGINSPGSCFFFAGSSTYYFMGVGIIPCCVTFIGCIAAESINGCCLCFVSDIYTASRLTFNLLSAVA